MNTPPVTCADWTAYYDEEAGEVTVADDNPVYDPDAQVVVVAYLDDLMSTYPEWDSDPALELPLECPWYAFPPRRLQRVGTYPEDVREAPTDKSNHKPARRLTDGQKDLRDRLKESGEVEVAPDPNDSDRAILIFHKLSTEHTIDADGVVSDGPISVRLAKLADEYLEGDQ